MTTWVPVLPSQTPAWASISNTQNPGWGAITPAPYVGNGFQVGAFQPNYQQAALVPTVWSQISGIQNPNWTIITGVQNPNWTQISV